MLPVDAPFTDPVCEGEMEITYEIVTPLDRRFRPGMETVTFSVDLIVTGESEDGKPARTETVYTGSVHTAID